MSISQLIRRLERLKSEQGDIEIVREDGKPFDTLFIDKIHPTKNEWTLEHIEKITE